MSKVIAFLKKAAPTIAIAAVVAVGVIWFVNNNEKAASLVAKKQA